MSSLIMPLLLKDVITGVSVMEQDTSQATYKDYRDLWNYNLQKIEQIGHIVEESIHELESNHAGFEAMYAGIMRQLDILSSIYSVYNTLDGAEEVMRLKAVLGKYAASCTREGLDFNLVHNLLIKIADARNASFENYPALSHHEPRGPFISRRAKINVEAGHHHRWISFRRNNSWFIAPFSSVGIRVNERYPVISAEEPDYLNIDIHGTIFKIKDIFIKSLQTPIEPRYFIFLDRGKKNYAADEIGKRIYAVNDFIAPRIRPFKKLTAHPLSPGRIRLFGKNHIVLY
jgi:hypothetical protein